MSSSSMSVIAGPDVDMAELEGGGSVVAAAGIVDLDLNLGLPPPLPTPPPPQPDGLALGLGLGQSHNEPDTATQVPLRHNWPRFEPGISGLFPVANQDIDPFSGLDSPHALPPALNSSSAGSSSSTDQLINPLQRVRSRISTQRTHSLVLPDPMLQQDNEVHGRQPHSSHSHTTHPFRRLSRHLMRSRHTLDRPQMQPAVQFASPAESRSGLHLADAAEFSPSPEVLATLDRPRDSNVRRDCLHRSVLVPKESAPEPDVQEAKDTENGSPQANFDCNVCLDLAKDPVVTPCGHLFCWPCLYQWLHLHSHKKECPVCKGHVPEDAITPIYGRGNAQDLGTSLDEQHPSEIPARPHAHRIENPRRWQRSGVSEDQTHVGDAEGTSRDGRMEWQRDTSSTPRGLNSGVGRSVEQILLRLRIAQRLQREHLERRFMARHRVLLRSPSESRTGDAVRLEDIQVGVEEAQQYDDREQMLAQMAINGLQRADRLAVIRERLVASMGELFENLSNVQRPTVESGISARGHTGISGNVGRHNVVTSQDVQEVAEPVVGEDRTTNVTLLANIVNEDEQLDPLFTPLTQQRRLHEVFGGASSSSNVEPGLLHGRKRRRLN